MNAVVTVTSTVPVLAGPSLTSEQVTQMVMGEAAKVTGRDGRMLRICTLLDECDGWVHSGYIRETDLGSAEVWLATAAWSEGATVVAGGVPLKVPHRGRLQLEGSNRVRLPDGRPAEIVSGSIRPVGMVIQDAMQVTPAVWAWREFAGVSYLWGGVTSAGIDCSGLVQVTFLARGVPLPRDAARQVEFGIPVTMDQLMEGDLVFFHSRDSERIGHVAMYAGAGNIVHATVNTGQVTLESWQPGSRAESLRSRAAEARRLT